MLTNNLQVGPLLHFNKLFEIEKHAIKNAIKIPADDKKDDFLVVLLIILLELLAGLSDDLFQLVLKRGRDIPTKIKNRRG